MCVKNDTYYEKAEKIIKNRNSLKNCFFRINILEKYKCLIKLKQKPKLEK